MSPAKKTYAKDGSDSAATEAPAKGLFGRRTRPVVTPVERETRSTEYEIDCAA
jgi:hypothetical protein